MNVARDLNLEKELERNFSVELKEKVGNERTILLGSKPNTSE